MSFASLAERDYDSAGAAESGWRASWEVSPGELFCTSVFPPRPYPWAESFKSGWRLMRQGAELSAYDSPSPYMDTWLLWNHIPMLWGHSYSDEYEPGDPEEVRAIVEKVHSRGERVMVYMSAYWTPTRDADVYVAGVRKFAEEYGIDGVYSDGLPATDWMLAYREMRLLRELFPDGPISIHDSVRQSALAIAQFKPFLYSYATFNYMAEGAETSQGIHWQYPRYLTTMFRKVNNIGVTKGDKWMNPDGAPLGADRSLVTMVYNGRDHLGFNRPVYYKALSKLEELWREKGGEPFFYDRYYLPRAQELSGYRIGRAAMPIVSERTLGESVEVTLESLTPGAVIHYTFDGTVPTEDSARYERPLVLAPDAAKALRWRAFAEGLDPSAVP